MNLKNKKIMVVDKGLFEHIAIKLARVCQVYYWLQGETPYPESPRSKIGTGYNGMERVNCPWPLKDEIDLWVFPDVYNSGIVESLRAEGRLVFGAGAGEELELDRLVLRETLKEVGLPVNPSFEVVKGVNNLRNYLKGKTDLYIKLSYFRGDFETFHHEDEDQTNDWLDDLVSRIGGNQEDIQFLVESPIEADCESGYDGFEVEGQVPEYSSVGYEIKDQGIIEKIFQTLPPIIEGVNKKMAPVFSDYGYRGFYSNELRITKDGSPYLIDATCRAGSPPSELTCDMYTDESYAKALFDVAAGQMPRLDPVSEYGAEIILRSSWYDKHQLRVKFPPEIDRYVKLKNSYRVGPRHYICVPNGNGAFFGAVIGLGDTAERAIRAAEENRDKIKCLELEFDKDFKTEAMEQIEKGARHGIQF